MASYKRIKYSKAELLKIRDSGTINTSSTLVNQNVANIERKAYKSRQAQHFPLQQVNPSKMTLAELAKISSFLTKASDSEMTLKLVCQIFGKELAEYLRCIKLIVKQQQEASIAQQFPIHPAFYGRKVFVGGLPSGITTDELVSNFRLFGQVSVDWPNKAPYEKTPPNGYAFLVFENSMSIAEMLKMCAMMNGKLCIGIHLKDRSKKVIEVKPWDARNNEAYLVNNWQQFSRYSVFVGGLPRTTTAYDLLTMLQDTIGDVAYCAIEIEDGTGYPKGAARVIFSSLEAYIKAIAMRELSIIWNGTLRVAEIKPFIMKKMKCEACQLYGAPNFCPEIRCLKYYCDVCWKLKHSNPGMATHKPMQKGRYFTTLSHHLGLDDKPQKRRHSQHSDVEAGFAGGDNLHSFHSTIEELKLARTDTTTDESNKISPAVSAVTCDSVFEFHKEQ